MEISDRTLIGLKLILEQFGLIVAPPLMVTSRPPNMDMVCSVIALMQLIHPMGYDFTLLQFNRRYAIRSSKLDRHIVVLRNKSSKGHFVVSGKRYALNDVCMSKIETILGHIKPPVEEFSFSLWLFLVGFWAGLNECASDTKIVDVILRDYSDFLPYIDYAEEQVTLIRSYSQRNVL